MHLKGELFFTSDKQRVYFNARESHEDVSRRFPWQHLAQTGTLLQSFIQDLGLKRTQSGRGTFCYTLDADEQAVARWFDTMLSAL